MVITEKEKRIEIIGDIHKGAGENVRARALSSHFGRNSTYEKVVKRFYWYSIYEDVNNLIKECTECQKQAVMPKGQPKLHPISIPSQAMKQVGIDLCFCQRLMVITLLSCS